MENSTSSEIQKWRVALYFAIKNDRRFLSHRDTVRLWQQVFSRCRLPLRYTQGFNPRIRMSLPIPRNVGVASDCELLVFELVEQVKIEDLLADLAGSLPADIEVLNGHYVDFDEPLYPYESSYKIFLNARVQQENLQLRIAEFLALDNMVYKRDSRGRHPVKLLDLKVTVRSLALEDNVLLLTMNIFRTGTSRIDEVMQTLELDTIKDIDFIQRIDAKFGSQIELPCG